VSLETLEAFAPAKVNLYLHVGRLRPDGFHPISSLMVFADIGDRLSAALSDRLSLEVEGPMAGHAPPGDDNLVLRAVRALAAKTGVAEPALRLVLHKALPAAAGLGGGSSDAAAALRLAREALGLELDDDGLEAVAAVLGSDIPACVLSRPAIAEGRGETLRAAPALCPLPAVLLRPPVDSATGPVYRAFDADPADAAADAPELPDTIATPAAAARIFAACRNDLEAPAVRLQPGIGAALAELRAQPETLLGRMSGSGSACFALCDDAPSAAALASRLEAAHPDWWIKACRLGGPWGFPTLSSRT
jgi:4-diphosphocytidyl-2-C-methyl-D-erythritol kinase